MTGTQASSTGKPISLPRLLGFSPGDSRSLSYRQRSQTREKARASSGERGLRSSADPDLQQIPSGRYLLLNKNN